MTNPNCPQYFQRGGSLCQLRRLYPDPLEYRTFYRDEYNVLSDVVYKPWEMVAVLQNQEFSQYEKLSGFLHLPEHPETKEDSLILLLVLDLIELIFYQCDYRAS